MANPPLEIEFIRDAINVMQDLNDQIKIMRGENDDTRRVDANIKALRDSIKDQTNN